ncbi:MAG: DoxX family protein [Gammaproteobacteria bacterium]|nr:DoxX family protein [Gammaproteobacteria bacterium]
MSAFINLTMISHFLIGFYFIFFAVWNIYHWSRIIEVMLRDGFPHPYLLLPIGIGWQAIAGFMILFGVFSKLAALSLIPYIIIASCIFHPFWNHKGEIRFLHCTIFMTNITIVISALLLFLLPFNNFSEFITIIH